MRSSACFLTAIAQNYPPMLVTEISLLVTTHMNIYILSSLIKQDVLRTIEQVPSCFLITICFRRIIIPAREQEVKPQILKRIRRNLEFLHTLWSLSEQNVCGEILVNSYILQHCFQKNTADNKLLYSS
jgi:hypothetical protein